jgi:putative Holliday junction resolvase
MRYLGIDYGKKKIGLALSDDDGSMAFAYKVIPVTSDIHHVVAKIVSDERVEKIIIGESKDAKGNDNAIMDDVRDFIGQMSFLVQIPIDTQREDFTTRSALQSLVPEKNVSRSRAKKPTGEDDALAAAIMLQRYLDRHSTK